MDSVGITTERYRKISAWFHRHPVFMGITVWCERYLPFLMYITYPFCLAVLILCWDPHFWSMFFVPLIVFLLVTILRKRIGRKRPYEALDIIPLVAKERNGQSFPSRHAASAVIIAVSFFSLNLWLGAAAMVVASLIVVSRPLCGLHYWGDVLGGALLSLAIGIPGFLLFLQFGL